MIGALRALARPPALPAGALPAVLLAALVAGWPALSASAHAVARPAPAQVAPPRPAQVAPAPAEAALAEVTPERLDSVFAAWSSPDAPGGAVAVLKDGRVVAERGYGSAQLEHGVPITPATIFHVASVSKQFTAFAIVLLAGEGKLSLDDDIRLHLPEVPDLGATVTVRHLIHHTSGIRDQWELLAMAGWRLDDVITKDQILAMMRRQRELNFPPGSDYLYSNMGYTLLAEIAARVSGMPFPELLQERVFGPLGMTGSHMHDDHEHVVPGRAYSYRPDGSGGWRNAVLSYANAGATSLFTTAGDLARWLRNFEQPEVGGPEAVVQMMSRGVLTDGDTLDYAFALSIGEHRGRRTVSHGGADAGFRSFVLHLPEERLGVVVLSNAANTNPGRLAHAVADLYLPEPVVAGAVGGGADAAGAARAESPAPASAQAAPASRPAAVRVSPRLLDAYEGRYELEGGMLLTIRRAGGGLLVSTGGDGSELVAESDTIFRLDAANVRIRFMRSGDRATGIEVQQAGRTMAGRRLEPPALGDAELAAYAGDYWSPELGTSYRIAVRDGGLVAVHHRHGDIPLTAVEEDVFGGGTWFFGRARMSRGEHGEVDGFRLTGGRVRDLLFVRLPEGALP